MILKNEFYVINGCTNREDMVCFDLSLQADHPIYKAHFPSEPITPGVCIIQIAKELMEHHLQCPLTITAVKNVKFLSVISPVEHPHVRYVFRPFQQTDAGLRTSVEVRVGDTTMTRLSFTCSFQS